MVKPATARSSQQVLAIRLMILAKGFSDITDRVQKEPDDFRLTLAKYLLSNLAGGGGEWRNTPASSLPPAISRLRHPRWPE